MGVINTRRVCTEYEIYDGKYHIRAIVDHNDTSTLKVISSKSHDGRFNFNKSTPETLMAIGKLLIEASDLIVEQ